jgi:ABC-2 type transport system permease protein
MEHLLAPRTLICRFVAKRTAKSAAFFALLFGVVVAAKSAGYAAAYPSSVARAKLASSFGSNIGLSALFGRPHDINTVTGFAVWNTLTIMIIIGAIWAFLTATSHLRGEEEAGRWEILLVGQTTARQASANALVGLGASLVVMYIVAAVVFIGVGKVHTVHYGAQAGMFFALAAVSSATMFMSVGSVASQLMPTRSRAAALSAAFFGACFLVRAMADTTNARWLLDVSPLGWIERLQPLYGSQPIWLLPIALLTLICAGAAIYLAGRRDLGDSVFADHDSAKPQFGLLGSSFGLAFRLTRGASLAWLLGAAFVSIFFGLLTKSASNAFSQSSALSARFGTITHASQTAGGRLFLGVVFFLLMTLIMAYAASSLVSVRREEAEDYLDNLLVRAVSRSRWLWGRVVLVVVTIICAGIVATLGVRIGLTHQGIGVSFHDLCLAGLNAMAPAVLITGLGVFTLGVLPRATSLVVYAALAWSFLLDLLSSGINLNHWILDTSILQHMSLSPAANPNWTAIGYIVGLGAVLAVIGSVAFSNRDLEAE